MKYIKVYSQIKEKKSGRKTTNTAFVTDFMTITKYQNPNDAHKAYLQKKQEGKDASHKRGTLQENWKGLKAKQIVKHLLKEQEIFAEKMKDDLEIKYWAEEK